MVDKNFLKNDGKMYTLMLNASGKVVCSTSMLEGKIVSEPDEMGNFVIHDTKLNQNFHLGVDDVDNASRK